MDEAIDRLAGSTLGAPGLVHRLSPGIDEAASVLGVVLRTAEHDLGRFSLRLAVPAFRHVGSYTDDEPASVLCSGLRTAERDLVRSAAGIETSPREIFRSWCCRRWTRTEHIGWKRELASTEIVLIGVENEDPRVHLDSA